MNILRNGFVINVACGGNDLAYVLGKSFDETTFNCSC